MHSDTDFSSAHPDKVYVDIPQRTAPTKTKKALYRVMNIALSPICAAVAQQQKVPGIEFHQAVIRLARAWLMRNLNSSYRKSLIQLMFSPVVLTRYHEFDFAWRHLPDHFKNYLDISSPSIFPVRVVAEHPQIQSLLINPDHNDLPQTQKLLAAAGLSNRCTTSALLVDDLDLKDGTFDLITSLSVVEHIPDNKHAIQKIWKLLQPGGKLLLTLPCYARAQALYTNLDHYGLTTSGASDNYTFMEYLYDEKLLQSFILDVTGNPDAIEIWGEINAGFLRQELVNRWAGSPVKYWKEPIDMGRAFKRYERISDLPGEGVVCLAFIKR